MQLSLEVGHWRYASGFPQIHKLPAQALINAYFSRFPTIDSIHARRTSALLFPPVDQPSPPRLESFFLSFQSFLPKKLIHPSVSSLDESLLSVYIYIYTRSSQFGFFTIIPRLRTRYARNKATVPRKYLETRER